MFGKMMRADRGGNGGGRGDRGSASSGRTGSPRGFAAMDPEEQRQIARKGGEAVSEDREHMAAIGRKGGEASHGGGRSRGNQNGENLNSGREGNERS